MTEDTFEFPRAKLFTGTGIWTKIMTVFPGLGGELWASGPTGRDGMLTRKENVNGRMYARGGYSWAQVTPNGNVLPAIDVLLTDEPARLDAFEVWQDSLKEQGRMAGFGAIGDKCIKCGGTGYIPEYSHIANGVCYDCGGTGRERASRVRAPPPFVPTPKRPLATRAELDRVNDREVARIKGWLAEDVTGEEFIAQWSQIGMSCGRTVGDQPFYRRMVKRAFEFANASIDPALATRWLKHGLVVGVDDIDVHFELPAGWTANVPGIYTYDQNQYIKHPLDW